MSYPYAHILYCILTQLLLPIEGYQTVYMYNVNKGPPCMSPLSFISFLCQNFLTFMKTIIIFQFIFLLYKFIFPITYHDL